MTPASHEWHRTLATWVIAGACVAMAIMLFLTIRYEREQFYNHVTGLIDMVTPALERLEAQDDKATKKVGRQNWKKGGG